MIKLIKFILITILVILTEHLYFEYIFSRDINDLLYIMASIASLIVFALYARYIYRLLIDILKINKD